MSVAKKGSYPANMKKVTDQEEAAEALKRSRRDYFGIGRINPDLLYELGLSKSN